MKVEFVGEKIKLGMKLKIKKAILCTLGHIGQDSKNLAVAVSFMGMEDMKELNNRTRGINKVTDVLSFPNFSLKAGDLIDLKDEANYTAGYVFLGDMAICMTQAQLQAEEYNLPLISEVIKLVVHSTLHLMGYDHIQDTDYAVMNEKEKQIAEKIK